MQLIKLIANKESFHPVVFRSGINIIIGKRTNPLSKIDGKTFNGVGKSLLVHLIHFCFCSNNIKPFEEKLPDWTFTLFFSHHENEYRISRNTSNQRVVSINGEKMSLSEARSWLVDIVIPENKELKFQPLLSCFARRYRVSYNKYNQSSGYPDDYSGLLYIGFLLGLSTELIIKKKVLRDEQSNLKKTEKLLKNDPVFKDYYYGKSDVRIDKDELEYDIERLKNEITDFKVSRNYHELERRANELSFFKKKLENDVTVIENNIKNIDAALKIQADLSVDRVVKMYEAASVEISDIIKKTLSEVEEFHLKLVLSRKERLSKELKRNKNGLNQKNNELESVGREMDQLLQYLNTHGALEEYTALNHQLTDYQLKLQRIEEYQNILKAFHNKLIELVDAFNHENKRTQLFLEESEDQLKAVRQKYLEMTKTFYPKKRSGISIENNRGENQLRFNIDAKIEDDSSDGVNEVKIFCFDMLLLLQKRSGFDFCFHDSRLLANMDPRQRATLYRIAYDICEENGFQYITTINEDALHSIQFVMDTEEYHNIIEDGIILTLDDESENSKLLGIQTDMDLEK